MTASEAEQWSDPNAGRVIDEAKERYRAVLRKSILAIAHQDVADRRAREAHARTSTEYRASAENPRDAKSVAALQRDGLARDLARARGENAKLARQIEDLQTHLHEARLHANVLLQDQAERHHDEAARARDQRISELAQMLDAKQAELDDANAAVEKAARDCRALEDRLASEKTETARAHDDIAALETERSAVQRELHTLQAEKDAHIQELNTLHTDLEDAMAKLEELESLASQHEGERAVLKQHISDLGAHESELETRCADSEAHIAALNKNVEALLSEIAERVECEKRYEATVSDYSSQIEEANTALQKSQTELRRLGAELEQERAGANELRQSLDAATANVSALQDVHAQLEAEQRGHAETNQMLTATREREEQLRTELADGKASLAASQKEMKRVEQQLAEAKLAAEQVHVGQSEKARMQQRLVAELEGANEKLSTRYNTAMAAYRQEHERLLALEKAATDAKRRCRTAEIYQQENERVVQKLEAENRELRDRCVELAEGFEREVCVRESLQAEAEDARIREQGLLTELEDAKHQPQVIALTEELHEAQERIAALEEELSRAMHSHAQPNRDAEDLSLLKASLAQTEAQVKQERHMVRQLQNQIQDLKGNIRVVVRVRPSKSSTLSNVRLFPNAVMLTGMQSTCKGIREVAKTYHFDRVLGPNASNKTVCEEAEYLVQSALDGHNVCIFAYGQTGSGKTWTMGSSDGVSMFALDSAMDAAKRSQARDADFEYTIMAESVEIYNEQFRDLLDDSPMLTGPITGVIPSSASGLVTGQVPRYGRPSISHSTGLIGAREACAVALKMNEKTRLPELVGTIKVVVKSAEHARELFAKAARARSVAATAANARSSRSHFVFIVHIERRSKTASCSDVQHSVLNLVDLAGSERLAHSKTTGDRLVETNAINSSLSTLGNVIKTLASREPMRTGDRSGERARPTTEHVTYRDSKLTFLLQGSLSGNSKAMLLATLSPEADHASETRSTLQFAETASRATVRH